MNKLWSVAPIFGLLAISACSLNEHMASPGKTIEGIVADSQGKPVKGAMVKARYIAGKRTFTVFSDERGRYSFSDLKEGEYFLEGLTDDFMSQAIEVNLSRSALRPANLTLDEPRQPFLNGAEAISSIPNSLEKRRLIQNCFMCHAVGTTDFAFGGRSGVEFWKGAIKRMVEDRRAYVSPDFDHAKQAAFIAKYLPANPEASMPERVEPRTDVLISEFDIPLPNPYPHDVCVDSKSRVWVADMGNDVLEMLDPETGDWKFYPYPMRNAGAHSVIEGPDGKIWIVLNVGNHIASFDPKAEEFKLYPVPDPGKISIGPRPHTHVFDSKGRLWYTEIAGNRVSRLDPVTGEITVFDLPEQPELFKDPFWLWPYGITVDSKDNIYYAKLGGNRIGKIDAVTGQVKEFEMPVAYSGPRRLDCDSRDNLWIPAFTTSKLYRFDTRTEQFKEYEIPTTDCTPYALYVDKQKDRVLICEASADRIGVFDILTEKFSEILLPSRLAYTRKIDVDKNTGMIWTSYSQNPTDYNKIVGIKFTGDQKSR